MLEAALAVLGVQGILGAWDNIRNHEFREALPHRNSQGRELLLHAARQAFYLVLFPTMAWLEWRGWLAWMLLVLIVAEAVVTCWDFVEEDRTRRLSAEERVLHTVLTLNYGVFLGPFIPVVIGWSALPAGIGTADRGAWSWLMTTYTAGVLVFGLRELLAVLRMRQEAMTPIGDPPYLRALGAALPIGLHRFHSGAGTRSAAGTAQVRTGGAFARGLLRFLGMGLRDGPQSLLVTFTPDGGGEIWARQFATGGFASRVDADAAGTLVESFGLFSFRIALKPVGNGLTWTLQRTFMFGVPLPAAIAPRISAREWMTDTGCYCMIAEVALPLVGALLRYDGEFPAR